jgi:predicted amidophosphoribosyltransferase
MVMVQLRALVDLVLPPACAVCGDWSPRRPDGRPRRVCLRCRSGLRPPTYPACGRCHAPARPVMRGALPLVSCSECSEWPEVLRSARWVAVQEGVARDLIHALKYGGWPELAEEMAGFMLTQLEALDLPLDVPLVPVPTTEARLKQRGYNQAERLATVLSHGSGRPVRNLLQRMGEGPSQVALPRDARLANVEGAFSVLPDAVPPGVSLGTDSSIVILVDDVLTTGSTAAAAAGVLGAEGVTAVHLITFARALSDGADPVAGILPPDNDRSALSS